jgi:hypothetical protein
MARLASCHSVIDANVVDTSFFPSIAAMSPALTASLAAAGRA